MFANMVELPAWLLGMGLAMLALPASSAVSVDGRALKKDASVLILGGGVAGVIAARTLHEQGITNFTIVEAKSTHGLDILANLTT